jgi:CRP/FNR family transcriptional regulator, cyclic AMP receptor protein
MPQQASSAKPCRAARSLIGWKHAKPLRCDGLGSETSVLCLSNLLHRWNPRNRHPYSAIKLFSTLTFWELRNIASALHDRTYIQGEVVFDEGEIGQAIYFVLEGTVTLRRTLPDGHLVLAHVETGESFGALALLVDEPREAQAIAQTNCQLAIFFRSDLHRLMDTRVAAASKISLEMARHLARILRNVALQTDRSVEI